MTNAAHQLSDITSAFLAIDFQLAYLNTLNPNYADDLCRKTNALITALPPEVPTIKIVVAPKFQIHAGSITPRSEVHNQYLFNKYLISGWLPLRPNNDLVAKTYDDVFDDIWFRDYLRQRYPNLTTLAIGGLQTRKCIARTIVGALMEGFDCVALIDLIGDHARKGPHDLVAHEKTLRKYVYIELRENGLSPSACEELMQHCVSMTSQEYLQSLKEKPALPVKKAPASILLAKTLK